MKKKFIGALSAVTTIILMASTSVTALGSSSAGFKTVTLMAGTETVGKFNTSKTSVDDFLKENSIELKENEIVVYDSKEIVDNSVMVIEPAIKVSVTIDGQKSIVETRNNAEVSELLKQITIENDGIEYYYVEGKNTDVLKDGMEINLLSRREETFKTTDVLEYSTIYEDTTDLEEGVTELVTAGVDGEITSTIKVVFYGGEEYLKKTVSEDITVAPVNEVIRRGVAKTVKTPNGNLKYDRAITMSASAYTAGAESTGKNPGDSGYGVTATGMKVRHGVVAVDPNVIPLGTKLYIEGYGEAVAADTGGAIKGNKVDLFYHDVTDALNFGRRNVKVYVLK